MGRIGEDKMTTPQSEKLVHPHEIIRRTVSTRGEPLIHCKCGASWSMDIKSTEEDIQSIFKSHIKYFHNKTVVL